MLRFAVPVLAATFAAAPLLGADPPPPRVARYVLAESRKSVSPAGERASAIRGPVVASGGTARWDLSTGSFPRTTANTLLVGEREGWLLDREVRVAARARAEDVRGLFVAPEEGDAGPFQSAVRGLELSAPEVAKGPAFRGQATSRHRLAASWSLVTSMPGRVARVKTRLTAVVDVLDEPPDEVRSPLDDLGRLLDVPVSVREALAPQLAAIRGWPVGVVVEARSELGTEFPGMEVPAEDRRPVTSRTETRREITDLVLGPAGPGELEALTVGEGTRVVGIERLLEPRESLR